MSKLNDEEKITVLSRALTQAAQTLLGEAYRAEDIGQAALAAELTTQADDILILLIEVTGDAE